MAIQIPAFNTCSQHMTAGERRLAQRLQEKLGEDYLLWYNVPVGSQRLYPDFILLHPQRGILVLEVKDWKLSTLQQANPETVSLLTPDGIKEEKNPLEQARGYALAICQMLEQDPLLVQAAGRFQGKLAFPYSYGVVFTHITRKQFNNQEGLREVFKPSFVIFQDEFSENVDPGEFQQRLENLSAYEFGEPLTSAQIDRIRWHLFPEVRIGVQLSLFPEEPQDTKLEVVIPDLLHVMDLQQEQIARSLGEGHRVIHGVAGSGKTLILVYRCLDLAQKLNKPILVLCFNVALAAKLRQVLHEKGISELVTVRHFHRWCSELLWQYQIPRPNAHQFQGSAYFDELVQRVIRAVEAHKIPAGTYGALLIDEGHDFRPEWLKLAVQMVDPETNSFLLLYDDAQSIYEAKGKQKVSFKRLGIQAQGRTTVLKLNYRNTLEILSVAYEFAQEMLTPTEGEDEDTPLLVRPQSAGRRGPQPELIELPTFTAEVNYLVKRVQQFSGQGSAWNQIAIVCRFKWMAERIGEGFEAAQIPIEWINQNHDSREFNPVASSIKMLTMHSSKGLEFPIVLIPGLGYMPTQNISPLEEARVLYVAMTRAIDQLVMTANQRSSFVTRVAAALRKVS
jgi:hypothetical protein